MSSTTAGPLTTAFMSTQTIDDPVVGGNDTVFYTTIASSDYCGEGDVYFVVPTANYKIERGFGCTYTAGYDISITHPFGDVWKCSVEGFPDREFGKEEALELFRSNASRMRPVKINTVTEERYREWMGRRGSTVHNNSPIIGSLTPPSEASPPPEEAKRSFLIRIGGDDVGLPIPPNQQVAAATVALGGGQIPLQAGLFVGNRLILRQAVLPVSDETMTYKITLHEGDLDSSPIIPEKMSGMAASFIVPAAGSGYTSIGFEQSVKIGTRTSMLSVSITDDRDQNVHLKKRWYLLLELEY